MATPFGSLHFFASATSVGRTRVPETSAEQTPKMATIVSPEHIPPSLIFAGNVRRSLKRNAAAMAAPKSNDAEQRLVERCRTTKRRPPGSSALITAIHKGLNVAANATTLLKTSGGISAEHSITNPPARNTVSEAQSLATSWSLPMKDRTSPISSQPPSDGTTQIISNTPITLPQEHNAHACSSSLADEKPAGQHPEHQLPPPSTSLSNNTTTLSPGPHRSRPSQSNTSKRLPQAQKQIQFINNTAPVVPRPKPTSQESLLVRTKSAIQQKARKELRDIGKFKKAPNSFLYYRQEIQKKIIIKLGTQNHKVISKIAGECWKLESESTKETYRKMARDEKAQRESLYALTRNLSAEMDSPDASVISGEVDNTKQDAALPRSTKTTSPQDNKETNKLPQYPPGEKRTGKPSTVAATKALTKKISRLNYVVTETALHDFVGDSDYGLDAKKGKGKSKYSGSGLLGGSLSMENYLKLRLSSTSTHTQDEVKRSSETTERNQSLESMSESPPMSQSKKQSKLPLDEPKIPLQNGLQTTMERQSVTDSVPILIPAGDNSSAALSPKTWDALSSTSPDHIELSPWPSSQPLLNAVLIADSLCTPVTENDPVDTATSEEGFLLWSDSHASMAPFTIPPYSQGQWQLDCMPINAVSVTNALGYFIPSTGPSVCSTSDHILLPTIDENTQRSLDHVEPVVSPFDLDSSSVAMSSMALAIPITSEAMSRCDDQDSGLGSLTTSIDSVPFVIPLEAPTVLSQSFGHIAIGGFEPSLHEERSTEMTTARDPVFTLPSDSITSPGYLQILTGNSLPVTESYFNPDLMSTFQMVPTFQKDEEPEFFVAQTLSRQEERQPNLGLTIPPSGISSFLSCSKESAGDHVSSIEFSGIDDHPWNGSGVILGSKCEINHNTNMRHYSPSQNCISDCNGGYHSHLSVGTSKGNSTTETTFVDVTAQAPSICTGEVFVSGQAFTLSMALNSTVSNVCSHTASSTVDDSISSTTLIDMETGFPTLDPFGFSSQCERDFSGSHGDLTCANSDEERLNRGIVGLDNISKYSENELKRRVQSFNPLAKEQPLGLSQYQFIFQDQQQSDLQHYHCL